MKASHIAHFATPARGAEQEADIHADIRYLEARLAEMGLAGDCAYERALAQTFTHLLRQRRQSLSRLRRP